jgi:hypothetical protein
LRPYHLISAQQFSAKGCYRPAYSITLSARIKIDCGNTMPSAFAVLRLMVNRNLTGSWTGISLGFAPRKMRSA